MSVTLKWITPNAEQMIADCARVSSDPTKTTQPDDRLLSYLIRNRHWSPLEMASACMEVHTTRDIARQILRHRSFSFQEFSQRYQDVGILGSPTLRECRMQHSTNRQMSMPCETPGLSRLWDEAQRNVYEHAAEHYELALGMGIAKEVARALLPEGLTPSRMFMSGTIRSWVHFIDVRTDETAQAEIRSIAHAARDILAAEIPTILSAVSEVSK